MLDKLRNLSFYEKLSYGLSILFLIVLLILASVHKIGGYGVETDFYGSYALDAFNILEGREYQEPDHGPGYSLLLIPFYLVLGDMFWAGKLLTILSATLLGLLSYKILRNLFDEKSAFFTQVLLILVILPNAYLASNDLPFAFLTTLVIYIVFSKEKLSYKYLLFAGLVAGYAMMTRMNAIILPISIATILLFINPEEWDWRKRITALSIFAATFLVMALPWFIINLGRSGNPVSSEVYQTIGAAMFSTSAEISWAEEKNLVAQQYDSLFSLFIHNPISTFKFFFWNVLGHFQRVLVNLLPFPIFLFFAPGALFIINKINKRQLSLYSFALFGFLIYCMLAFSPRFFFYVGAFFMLPAIYFLFHTENIFTQNKIRTGIKYFSLFIYAFAVILLLKTQVGTIKNNLKADPVDLYKVSQSVQKHSSDEDTIIARKPHLGFINKRKVIYFPEVENLDGLIQFAKEKQAKLILYSIIEEETRPQLKILQEPEKVGSDFTLIYSHENPDLYLYKLTAHNSN